MNLRLSWESPWWLLALVLVPYAYWRWRRYVLLPGIARQQRWVPLLRALALFCLILAAAGTTVWAPRPGVELHVLVDASASVLPEGRERAFGVVRSLAELLGPHDRIMLYAFGGDVVSLGEIERGGGVPGAVAADPGATDIAAALTVALGRAAPGANARILLISDGVESVGTPEPWRRWPHPAGLPSTRFRCPGSTAPRWKWKTWRSPPPWPRVSRTAPGRSCAARFPPGRRCASTGTAASSRRGT